MTLEKKQEFTLKITQANKTQLITILYEMVMDYLDEAIDAFAVGTRDDAEKSIRNAQNCIDELIHSLNMEYELARNLHKIYIFSKKELSGAYATGNIHRVWKVKKNFESLHEAYVELEKYDESESIMDNTQKVYAGLTYGRYALNEDITAVSMNRGLMA
ncbi:flagellar protein FliS [Butyrivibrio sp. CB08]|uniref:flagellar export chaperone FliS n=1 Tax=Butyrivibrio sp. CB08 TaxID=2364879 RepID=UPI000EA87D62|nr:flagellar protein FliS [Butyrivibrio sp. CB08]RKM58895.1 flagellar protein FliS [Butyrivibrio sp. CB08]